MLTFGFLLFGAIVLHQAADVGAQELARHPFSPTGTFEEALEDSGLFNEADLVIPANTDPNTLPLINRLVFPLYIYDVDIDHLRYPGALVRNSDGDLTILIPIVGFGNRDPATGVETIYRNRSKLRQTKLARSASEEARRTRIGLLACASGWLKCVIFHRVQYN